MGRGFGLALFHFLTQEIDMNDMTLAQAQQSKTVMVELVADREFKDDCRANTGIVWRGKGDKQPFPAHLWHKLAAHPDVWKLADSADGNDYRPPSESPEARNKREQIAAAEKARAKAEEAAGQGVDLVNVAAIEPAEPLPSGVEEAAGESISGTEGDDAGDALDEDAPQDPEAPQDPAEAEYDAEIELQGSGAEFADTFPYDRFTRDQQDKLDEKALRDLGKRLDYGLSPRLKEQSLRKQFEEVTEARAKGA